MKSAAIISTIISTGEAEHTDILLDDGECVVERPNMFICKVPADKFELVFVDQGGLHDDGIS